MMHDLFTRGIDTNGQLRPSHQDAPHLYKQTELGWIPGEWKLKELRECVDSDITYGIVQAGPHIDGGVPYIRTGDMSGDQFLREGMLCTSESISNSFKRSRIQTGEIVCAIRATVGKVLPVPPQLDGANLTQGTARIAPSNEYNNRYILWVIRSHQVQRELSLVIKGTTFLEITLDQLRKIKVLTPRDRDEQKQIAMKLDQLEMRLQNERTHLEKLQFVKKGLMQDLLTGKVRVKTNG